MGKITGERELIGKFAKGLYRGKGTLVAAGEDDAGCMSFGGKVLAATSDIMFRSSHFPKNMPHFCIGEKAAAANLSDLAAMGAKPLFALFDYGFTGDEDEREAAKLVDGANALCKKFSCAYLGGDTKKAGELTVAGFAVGVCERGGILRRNNARPGDVVALTGEIGTAACGLASMLEGLNDRTENAFLHPHPKVKEGMALAKYAKSTAAVDITDGLFYSLGEIARASKVGMEVETDLVSKETERFANEYGVEKNYLLGMGEDYELLVAMRPAAFEKAKKEAKLIEIGRVTKERKIRVDGEEAGTEGYDAFKKRK